MPSPRRRAAPGAIALSSGGKDSILALHMAVEAGYRVRGLLTVLPEDPESPLYHVPNVRHARSVAYSLGMPWFPVRAPPDDEEMALSRALHRLQPSTVITGGIASTFQRSRFTRIAEESGAQVYSPLWSLTAHQLYAHLLDRGIRAVVVAVAAYGLGPEWLGLPLTRPNIARLLAAAKRARFDPTGEGGDLDTFVLDAPLYRRRLEIVSAEQRWEGDHGMLRIRRLAARAKRQRRIPGPRALENEGARTESMARLSSLRRPSAVRISSAIPIEP